MKLLAQDYPSFISVTGAFEGISKVFYSKSGSDVIGATATFSSRDQYVEGSWGTGIVTEPSFLSAFPMAIVANVDATY